MYGSERYTVPLPRPFPVVYIPRPSSSISTNNNTTANNCRPSFSQRTGEINGGLLNDDVFNAYQPDAEISVESHQSELLACSELREFSCFSSYTSTLTDPGSSSSSSSSDMLSSGIASPSPSPSFAPASVLHHPSNGNAGARAHAPTLSMPTLCMPMPMPVPMPMSECARATDSEVGASCEGMSLRDEEDSRKLLPQAEERHRKRSKNWTRAETLKLISARSDIDLKFTRSGRKSELWDLISDALRGDGFSRDAQQCKDKWEKLCASFKEVGEGTREKEDFIYHDEIRSILSNRSRKRDKEREAGRDRNGPIEDPDFDLFGFREEDSPRFRNAIAEIHHGQQTASSPDQVRSNVEYVSVADLPAIHKLMDTLLAKQQDFFAHLLDTMEKRDEVKEKLRQEREDKWRAEELEQKKVFNNTMVTLIRKLDGRERHGQEDLDRAVANSCDENNRNSSFAEPEMKKRPRNWKRSKVSTIDQIEGKDANE